MKKKREGRGVDEEERENRRQEVLRRIAYFPLVRNWGGGSIHRQQGDLISLLLFF
jgi:hypothetical protein